MNNTILEFKNVSKSYSSIKALKNISFKVPENSIFGILGANGSGKSTFMKILSGLIYNWGGEIYLRNKLIHKNNLILRKQFGYLIESPTFYEYLSARKNLELLARISEIDYTQIDYTLDLVNLSKRANDKVHSYSYGMKQRLGIAQTLIHNPKIIILDEPNNGLDPNGIDDMIRLIKDLKSEGKTICLSTHNLRDVEELCTHFTVFNNGTSSNSNSISNQIEKSNRWLLNVDNPSYAINKIESSKSFNLIHEFNKNILIESSSVQTVSELNNLLKDIEVYKINKQSNLIEYFEDNKTIL